MSEHMKLDHLLAEFKDGDEHGWEAEFDILRREHGRCIRELTSSVLQRGIHTPILLGNDGRVWDGHHRLYVAHALGFNTVPVEYARAELRATGQEQNNG